MMKIFELWGTCSYTYSPTSHSGPSEEQTTSLQQANAVVWWLFMAKLPVYSGHPIFWMLTRDPRMRRISYCCYFIALYSKPFFAWFRAWKLSSCCLEGRGSISVSTFQTCWLSTFQIWSGILFDAHPYTWRLDFCWLLPEGRGDLGSVL